MSIPRYKINPLFGYLKDSKEGKFCEYRDYLKLEAENARLKAEVLRMASFTTRTIIPNEKLEAECTRLKDEVERLTKAGDAFEKEFDYLTESMRMLDNEKALLKKLFSKWKSAKKSTR